MATRKETQQRRQALLEELRASCRNGSLAQGEMLPPVRNMAERYNVSHRIIVEALQSLTEEGLLYSVSRVGTFVGRPKLEKPEYYLYSVPNNALGFEYSRQIQFGFEERVTALGGASLVLSHEEILEHADTGGIPTLAGVFDLVHPFANEEILRLRDVYPPLHAEATPLIPYVQFGDPDVTRGDSDEVQFDNIEGGRQATQHLLLSGHRNIAFLGLHAPTGDPGRYYWSLERERGWTQAMEKAGLGVEGLAFHPQTALRKTYTTPAWLPNQIQAAHIMSADIVKRTDISAIVIANVEAANGYFMALHDAKIPVENWPAVLCFDEVLDVGGSFLSYLRLPWSDLGREAAQILWERKNGRLTGPVVHRQLQMRLIARLSCRSKWALSSTLIKNRTLPEGFRTDAHPINRPF